MINIGGSEDPAYRYKMPRITVKIEGKGNGIKTVITNMSQIALALRRDPALPTKYFGCELGAQSRYNPETDKAVVNGAHEASTLQSYLNGFVSKFVLCPKCSLPETDLIVKPKSGTIVHKCAACGNKAPVDMMHKLVTFILKESKGAPTSKKSKKGEKKDSKKKKEESSDDEEAPAAAAADAPAVDAPVPSTAADLGDEDGSGSGSDSEEEAGEDVATSGAVVVDDSSALEAAVDALKAFIVDNKDSSAVAQQARQLQTNSALPLEDRVRLYYLAAFDGNLMKQSGDAKVLGPLATIIAGMEADPRKLQSFKFALLDCVEEHVGTRTPALLPVTPIVLKNLYDNDILDEDVIIEWANRAVEPGSVADTVRQRASPFVSWLKDAEAEEEEEEEGGEEGEGAE